MSKFAPFDSSFCTHIFICMPIWLADIVSTWKNVNKETSSKLPLRPNFNILYHCLYLRGCPQIHILFYSGLWSLSSAPPPPVPPSPIADSRNMFGLPLWRFVFIRHFLPSNKFEDFAFFFPKPLCHTLTNRFQASTNPFE